MKTIPKTYATSIADMPEEILCIEIREMGSFKTWRQGWGRDGPLVVVFRCLGFRPRWLSGFVHCQRLHFRSRPARCFQFLLAAGGGKVAAESNPSLKYEQGWNAINELVRSDSSWSGPERNVFYANNRDGTFSDVSGAIGLDFPDDSRSFVLADLDHDGRLEVILKNRNAPQLRVLHNAMKDIGHSIAFRLCGQKSNRDAIGAAVTVEAGDHRQTKYLQAGSGFLSQHTKELFFGVGKVERTVRATIRWPSGLSQVFEDLPVRHRIEIQEGSDKFLAKPFAVSPPSYTHAGEPQKLGPLPSAIETWLIEPLSAPDFSLPDLAGKTYDLPSLRGTPLLLNFWSTASPACEEQMKLLRQSRSSLVSSGLRVVGINVDDPRDVPRLQAFVPGRDFRFPPCLPRRMWPASTTLSIATFTTVAVTCLFPHRSS